MLNRSSLVLVTGLLILSACSTNPAGEQNSQSNDPGQVTTSKTNTTDMVPDDHNPEMELAIAGGVVIVNDDSQKTAAQANEVPGASVPGATVPGAVPGADPVAALDPQNMNANSATTKASDPVLNSAATTAATAIAINNSIPQSDVITQSGSTEDYKVKSGDTLMKIAYEQYGSIYRWREIYASNKDLIQDPNNIPPGSTLKLASLGTGRRPSSVEHVGDQYMIELGDTLGSISQDLYGSTEKWKAIWENNRLLIKDPNKIYAGFYLYYVPEHKITMN